MGALRLRGLCCLILPGCMEGWKGPQGVLFRPERSWAPPSLEGFLWRHRTAGWPGPEQPSPALRLELDDFKLLVPPGRSVSPAALRLFSRSRSSEPLTARPSRREGTAAAPAGCCVGSGRCGLYSRAPPSAFTARGIQPRHLPRGRACPRGPPSAPPPSQRSARRRSARRRSALFGSARRRSARPAPPARAVTAAESRRRRHRGQMQAIKCVVVGDG